MKDDKYAPRTSRLKELFPFDWELLRHAGSEPVPYHLKKWWFCLGGTVLYLFIIQVITGITLTFYYIPSPDQAYESVAYITKEVRFGWYIRSLHHWSSIFMIIAVILHMIRVFFTGAYRHPRQMNWMIGFMLLGVTLTFGFTGYSLVYEQLSFWGATVATNIAGAVPLVGQWLGSFIRGGPEVGGNTMTRLFVIHVGLLPTITMVLIGLHILLIRLHGVTELRFEGEVVPEEERHFRFWPEHATTELIIGVLLMYVLTILALVYPAELGDKANPAVTPQHIKPEWYFYFNYRILKLTTLRLSVLLTMVVGATIFFWPFIEEKLFKQSRLSDRFSVIAGTLAFLGFLLLTVWESFSF
jgi:quinol-cytochrome oxidoreductase complex cytochrome b subunit